METKVTWRNKNPFCPRLEDLTCHAEAQLDDNTPFEQIEQWANEATPEGYWLYQILTPLGITRYTPQGEVVLAL